MHGNNVCFLRFFFFSQHLTKRSAIWVGRDEIFEYYQKVAKKYKLDEITLFKTTVRKCIYDDKNDLWKVKR
jgi:cation diffusion facilitator CzcD-associated flavoprotein CzcO